MNSALGLIETQGLVGLIYSIEAVLPAMLRRGTGHLVAISSLAAFKGLPGESAYCASKAAVNAYMEGLRIELRRRGVAAATVCPGFIDTPMTHVLTGEQKAKMLQAIPAGRLGTPEDVAASVVFLTSAEAAYLTGATLHVNGGMAML